MKKIVFLALALGACGSSNTAMQPQTPPTGEQSRDFADGTNRFAVDLHSRLPREGNLVYSPASISLALAMTYAGAEGNTEAQMRDVMHFGEDPDAIHAAAAGVLANWNGDRDTYELAIANRLFGEQSFTFEDPFLALTRERYGAELEKVDFIGHSEESRVRINGWVAEQTRDRIRDLIPRGAIDASTRLVLTNAIYLHADWAHPFTREATHDAEFFAPSGTVNVPMMHRTIEVRHAHEGGAQILELPYQGGDLAMWIALPDERDGIGALEGSLSAEQLQSWEAALAARRVEISIPKVRIDPAEPIALAQTLAEMGMPDAFDPDRADFSAMSTAGDLFIDSIFHKAFVAIDERGTEAAAATAVVMAEGSARIPHPPDAVFNADHPYLFFIRDQRSGAILFVGRVTDPT